MAEEGMDIGRLLETGRRSDPAAVSRLLDAHRNYLSLYARIWVVRSLRGEVNSSDLVQRVGRRSRRHKALVASAAVILLVATVALSASNVLIARQRNRAETAMANEKRQRQEAQRQRERADANYQLAGDAVEKLLDRLAYLVKELSYQGDVNDAGQIVQLSLELDGQLPDEIRASVKHQVRLARMHLHRGRSLILSYGLYDEAEEGLRSAVNTLERLSSESSPDRDVLLALCHYWRGEALRNLAHRDNAADSYRKSLILFKKAEATESIYKEAKIQASDVRVYCRRMADHLEKEELKETIKEQSELIRREPQTGVNYRRRGTMLRDLGQNDGAIEDYTTALRLYPADRYAGQRIIRACVALGQPERALLVLTNVIASLPNSCRAYNNRGLAYLYANQPKIALEDLTRAAELNSVNMPYLWNNRAVCLTRLGQLEEAIRVHTRGLEVSAGASGRSNRSLVYLELGNRAVVYAELGQFEDAIADLQTATDRRSAERFYEISVSGRTDPRGSRRREGIRLNLLDHARSLSFERPRDGSLRRLDVRAGAACG